MSYYYLLPNKGYIQILHAGKSWRNVRAVRNIRSQASHQTCSLSGKIPQIKYSFNQQLWSILPSQPNQTQTIGCLRQVTCPQWRWRAVSGHADKPSSPQRALWASQPRVRSDPDSLTEVYPVKGPPPTSHLSRWASPSSWWSVTRLLVHPWKEAKYTISFSGTVNLKYTPYGIHSFVMLFVCCGYIEIVYRIHVNCLPTEFRVSLVALETSCGYLIVIVLQQQIRVKSIGIWPQHNKPKRKLCS